jgi:FPC/CPF motif-containing protein YcgG
MENPFKIHLSSHILETNFPCIMAKAVVNKGFFHTFSLPNLNTGSVKTALKNLHNFISEMHTKKARLSSCVIVIEDEKLNDFPVFENKFWSFLKELNSLDKKSHKPDPSVDADPTSSKFSFSIKSESFFIIALHPESPRWARRFKYPAIVFNPHKQFEELRENGTYKKVRDLIRKKDKLLQGNENPMLQNFGEKSEVYQYLGKIYSDFEPVPLTF